MAGTLGRPPGPITIFSAGFYGEPLEFLLAIAKTHGDVASFRCGWRRYVLLNRPDLIGEVLDSHAGNFGESPLMRRAKRVFGASQMRFGAAAESPNLVRAYAIYPRLRWPFTALVTRRCPLRPEDFAAAALEDAVEWTRALAAQHGLEPTEHVFAEALRLYPPVWFIERRTLRRVRLYNYDIPAGTTCIISPYVLHRNKRYWTDPLRFDPCRWEGAPPARFTYLPFGMADRQELAWRAAAELLRLPPARPSPAMPKPQPSWTLRPTNGS